MMDYQGETMDCDTRETSIINPVYLDKENLPSVKTNNHEYNRLKLLGAQILLFLALVVSLVTTVGVIWIILRLNLTNDLKLVESDQNRLNDNELLFNQDLFIDTLSPQKTLQTRQIIGNEIKITGSDNSIEPQAEIYLNQKSISMQAQSFSNGRSQEYSFKTPKRTEYLDVPNNIRNVKVIRALHPHKDLSPADKNHGMSVDIVANGKLDISGNMGLKVHSNHINIISQDSINIESKEESITIMAEKGIRLPSLDCKGNDENSSRSFDESTSSIQSTMSKFQLCINRDDGLIFQSINFC